MTYWKLFVTQRTKALMLGHIKSLIIIDKQDINKEACFNHKPITQKGYSMRLQP